MSYGAGNGSGGSIAGGSDVALNNPANGQVLGYNATISKWQNLAAAGAQALTATAVKTSAYTAAAGDLIPIDASSGVLTVTLPAAPADKTRVSVKKIDTTTNVVTVTTSASDVFNKSSGSTSITLQLLNQSVSLQYATSGAIWYVVSDDLPLGQLDSRFDAIGTAASAVAGASIAGPAGPAGLIWRGTYSNSTTYAINDAALYAGSAYICTAGTTGVSPGTPGSPNAGWNLLVQQGGAGPQGAGAVGMINPSDVGLLAWPYDSLLASSTGQPVGGVLMLHRINAPAATYSNAVIYVATAGATLTSGANLIGLYSSTGTLLASTADQSTAWTTTGLKTTAFTTPYTLSTAGYLYVAVLGVGTTLPFFGRASSGVNTAQLNALSSASLLRSAAYGSAQTALPASITTSSMVGTSSVPWVGLA